MKEYNVFYVYGTASKQNPGPKVRKDNYPSQREESEITNGILSVNISSYGDAPELAYVEVVAVDEHLGKRAFERAVYEWQNNTKERIWQE